ncbi:unnamed protein product [Mesocestoides corti]|uniref:PHD-type domain-containing protein n=1 Tax=Mesocestoides corti TaxID=53468 RepID=A0A0R3U2S2_MESCO|nr:unnamed protein product [Mesocestoides corti]
MPGTNRLDKRRSKFRAGHLFSANRVIPRRRPAYSHDAPDRQFYVLKRRFAAFDTSPMPLPLVSCNGNSVSFFPEDGSNTLMSDGTNRVSSSGNLRRIPSAGSIESIDQNVGEHEFGPFHTESQDFCDEDDDLQLTIDSTKRGRTLATPQRSAGTPVDVPGRDPHRSHHGGTCYSPFVATSDTEAVTLGTAGSNIVADQSIDDLLTNPTVPASPSVKCDDSPRWLGSASITDKTRRLGGHSRRPSRMSSSTVDSNEETGGYVSSNELHHHPHRYSSSHSPARSVKDQQQESLPMAVGAGGEADEQRYCFCNDVSYGDMIACDAPTCPFEWFHYSCVGLTVAPKGQWFCPSCAKGGAISTRFAGTSSASRKRSNHRR